MVSVLNYAGVCLPLLKNSALCLWSKSDMLSCQPWILLAVFRLNNSWMYTPLIDMSLCHRWCRSRDIFIARKCRTWARKSSKLCAYTYIQGGPKIQHRILCKLVLNHIKERKWIYPYTTRSFARELLPMTFNSLVLIFLTESVFVFWHLSHFVLYCVAGKVGRWASSYFSPTNCISSRSRSRKWSR